MAEVTIFGKRAVWKWKRPCYRLRTLVI